MALVKKIKADDYLRRFVDYCKSRFGGNLIAVGVFGSYALGYFDKKKSDYDVFVILKNPDKISRNAVERKFKKISFQYLLSEDELIQRTHFGHWTLFITLLTSARVVYSTKDYKRVLWRLKKINLFEKLIDLAALEAKTNSEIKSLAKLKGYNAVKWALPSVRKRLQMLSYIRRKKLIWGLKNNLKRNKDILSKRERKFLLELNARLRKRSEAFSEYDREISTEIIHKINREIILHLGSLLNVR